jgi:hypothetical protein
MHGGAKSAILYQFDRSAADMRADSLPDHATIDTAVDGTATATARYHELPNAPGAESIHPAIPVGADLPVATVPRRLSRA